MRLVLALLLCLFGVKAQAASPTDTPTITPSITQTFTDSPTSTPTFSRTLTATMTRTPTQTATPTITNSPTPGSIIAYYAGNSVCQLCNYIGNPSLTLTPSNGAITNPSSPTPAEGDRSLGTNFANLNSYFKAPSSVITQNGSISFYYYAYPQISQPNNETVLEVRAVSQANNLLVTYNYSQRNFRVYYNGNPGSGAVFVDSALLNLNAWNKIYINHNEQGVAIKVNTGSYTTNSTVWSIGVVNSVNIGGSASQYPMTSTNIIDAVLFSNNVNEGFPPTVPSPTTTPTRTTSPTPTASPTPSISNTFTFSPTTSPTPSITQTETFSPTITESHTFSPTVTPSHTPTITRSPTNTPTHTITVTFTVTPTVTPTTTPTVAAGVYFYTETFNFTGTGIGNYDFTLLFVPKAFTSVVIRNNTDAFYFGEVIKFVPLGLLTGYTQFAQTEQIGYALVSGSTIRLRDTKGRLIAGKSFTITVTYTFNI